MDPSELTPLAAPPPAQEEQSSLIEEVQLLRKYLVITLTATVVVVFCFNAFLYRVDRSTRGQIEQAKRLRAELEQSVGNSLGSFLSQVVNYANAHPDVAQILAKYGIKPTASNAPTVTPAPMAVPKAAPPAGGAKK